jgi:DNA polymerase I-like protein with 3'-5' exonuclease and polymerase domains
MRKLILNSSDFGILNVFYLREDSDALKAIGRLREEKFLGFDTETCPLPEYAEDQRAGLDPHRNQLRLVQLATQSGDIYLFDLFVLSEVTKVKLKDLLESPLPVKVAHNANFDVKQSRKHLGVRHFGRVFCTDLGVRLIKAGGRKYPISLKDAVYEYLNIELKKESQLSDWSAPNLTDEQLEYAALDAFVVLRLRWRLLGHIKEMGLEQAAKIDFDVIDPVAAMELVGFPLDRDMWVAVDEQMQEKRWDVLDEIYDQLRGEDGVIQQQGLFSAAPLATKRKNRIKINSPKQVQWILEELGIEVPEKKDRKTQKVSKTTSTPFLIPIQKIHTFIPKLMLFRELDKRKTSYGAAFCDEHIHSITGRVHSRYDPAGTKTYRFNSNDPNLQNIPHLQEYRSCFRVLVPKRKFVSADYSQIELRVAAEASGDEGFIAAFNSGKDFHDATTVLMFGLPEPPLADTPERKAWEKTDEGKYFKEMRTYAKRINFGIIYGMGAKRLAMQTGLTEEEAQGYINKYAETFPKLMEYLENEGKTCARTGESYMWTGRVTKFFVDHKDKGSIAQAERNGKNTPIQGGAGEILKISLRLIWDEIWELEKSGKVRFDSVWLVNIIHDEVILECDEQDAEMLAELLKTCMIKAGELFLKRVPCKVDPSITDEWKK